MTTIEFPEFPRKMREDAQNLHDGKTTFFSGDHSKKLRRLPNRFTQLF